MSVKYLGKVGDWICFGSKMLWFQSQKSQKGWCAVAENLPFWTWSVSERPLWCRPAPRRRSSSGCWWRTPEFSIATASGFNFLRRTKTTPTRTSSSPWKWPSSLARSEPTRFEKKSPSDQLFSLDQLNCYDYVVIAFSVLNFGALFCCHEREEIEQFLTNNTNPIIVCSTCLVSN